MPVHKQKIYSPWQDTRQRLTVIALCIAAHLWCGGLGSLVPSLPCAAAATSMIHDTTLDEAVDFYQFTDHEGVTPFVDSPRRGTESGRVTLQV